MSTFRVTIKDIVCWTTTVTAKDAIQAESLAWELFDRPDRSDYFEDDSDTTVQVEPLSDDKSNESTINATN